MTKTATLADAEQVARVQLLFEAQIWMGGCSSTFVTRTP